MALGLRDIADMILLEIDSEQLVEPYVDQLLIRKLYESEKYEIYGDKVYQAVNYLHDYGFIVGDDDANGIIYFLNLTTKGNLRIEELKNQNINLSLGEISDLLLKLIDEAQKKEPHATGIDMPEIMNSKQIELYKDKFNNAIELLESEDKIKCYWAGGLPYAAGLKIKGKLRLEEIQNRKLGLAKIPLVMIFFNIMDVDKEIHKIDAPDEKYDYLKKLYEYYQKVMEHYKDEDLERLIKELGVQSKYPRMEYTPWTDFDHSHISKSEYSKFLREIQPVYFYISKIYHKLKRENEGENLTNNIEANTDTRAKNRIVWKGSVADIKELFKLLESKGLIETIAYPNAVIRDCFVKKDGKDYEPESTKKANTKGKSRNYNDLNKIVTGLNEKKGK